MGLTALLPLAAIVTTILFVFFSHAPPWMRAAAAVACVVSFLIPRMYPTVGYLSMAVQALLSVMLITALRSQRVIR